METDFLKNKMQLFKLDSSFIEKWSTVKPDFGFNGLGELVYMRTYSRLKDDGTNEKWFETIQRVVEGTYNLQKKHIDNLCLGWNPTQAQQSAQEMYTRMFEMKFLPPGRGLWAMGSDIINKKGLAAALNNCGFVSTQDIDKDFAKPFIFLMDMSMLGVGIGFDTEGEHKITIQKPNESKVTHVIEDTREGWVKSVEVLLHGYNHGINPEFDYSSIRKSGTYLKTFGGLSSGPQPLMDLHSGLRIVLDKNIDLPITITTIVDIMNLIGKCVVSGNIRRCLPEGTLIHTEKGLIPIEETKAGTMVYTSKGLSPTSELVLQGEQEVITIVTELGEFECTPPHKMAVMDKQGYIWKKANELTTEDELVFPKHSINIPGNMTTIDIYGDVIEISTDFGYILGYISGINYKALNSKTIDDILSYRLHGIINDDLEEIYFRLDERLNSTIGNILDKFVETREPYVPEVILRANLSIRKSYLQGLKEHCLEHCSLSFLKQVQCLYSTVGECWALERVTYYDNVYKLKQKYKNHTENFIGIKIKEIKITGKKVNTYDISVPGAHEFIASFGLLVHNTAEIAFGKYDSQEFMNLKDYSLNPDRMSYGWTSNNSIFAELGMDYTEVTKRININGEPGLAWLDNMRNFSRMCDPPNNKDYRVMGGNPCLEQSLEHCELCTLVEVFPYRADSLNDFLRTLKFAYLYAKTVTLANTHWEETNRVQLRNRRIGCSVSGLAQFLTRYNLHILNEWLTSGYSVIQSWDLMYSEWLCIPRSIKTTSVKPSGTVSLLAGATPGMHYPESRFYIRRMRLAKNSPLVEGLVQSGYTIEPAVGSENDTLVVEIPVDVGENIRTVNDLSVWEQVALAANIQRWWADNQVSCTVTFKPETEGHQIASVLDYFQYSLKGISFLPKCDYGAFPQMPYEEITEDTYNVMCKRIKPLDFFATKIKQDGEGEKFCDGDHCLN